MGIFFLRPTQLITNVRRKEGGREREREEKEKEREREKERSKQRRGSKVNMVHLEESKIRSLVAFIASPQYTLNGELILCFRINQAKNTCICQFIHYRTYFVILFLI